MTRERVGRIALRALPVDVRATRGAEMRGTLLDVSDGSVPRFAREALSLIGFGFEERARAAARVGRGRLLVDACRLSAGFWVAATLTTLWPLPELDSFVICLLLLWPVLACLLVGSGRLAGACGIVWTVGSQLTLLRGFGVAPALFATEIVPLLCFSVIMIAPRQRTRSMRRLLWLIPVIAISALQLQPGLLGYGTLAIGTLLAASLTGILLIGRDPRIAIACALTWTGIGMSSVEQLAATQQISPVILLAAAAPLTLAVVKARAWQLPRPEGPEE
jgi:hypothetical protein